ncbi:MAG: hypothetical protein KKE17_12245 [Proteobacteria bacterium]|nr:hypothetical protein [Pseudomonadota bacterium]
MSNTMKLDDRKIQTSDVESAGLDQLTHGTSQVGIGVIMAMAAMVGLWGFACLMGGLVKSGGPLEMLRGFFTAVIGG